MAKYTHTGEIVGKSATEVYQASLPAFERAGFEIWKERPLAWLSLARKIEDGKEISANLAARATSPTSYTLSLAADGLPEETLHARAEIFLQAFSELLEE
jgi:hypothetical protein